MKLKLRLNIETKVQNFKKQILKILKILNYTLCDIQLEKLFLMS